MTKLRVLLSAAPTATRADAWALYDDEGVLVREGRDPPANQPSAEENEAVIAAEAVRIVTVKLPPLAAERIVAATRFAIEDQLAGPATEHALTVSPQRADGQVNVVVASAALLAALTPHFARVIAEPSLVMPSAAARWRWCAAGNGEGFVRAPDGGAFAVSETVGGSLPAELKLALDHAARGGRSPSVVDVAFAGDDAALARWSAVTGVPFQRVANWRWATTPAAIFDAAAELLPAGAAGSESARRPRTHSTWKYAAIIAGAALFLHVLATFGEWTKLRFGEWRTKQELADVARTIEVPFDDDVAVTTARIARAHANARHRVGRSADDDALPLLARAAPGLAALPAGALKSATYADGAWTFDLAKLEAPQPAELERRLAAAGLATLKAPTPSGLRVRATLAAGKS